MGAKADRSIGWYRALWIDTAWPEEPPPLGGENDGSVCRAA